MFPMTCEKLPLLNNLPRKATSPATATDRPQRGILQDHHQATAVYKMLKEQHKLDSEKEEDVQRTTNHIFTQCSERQRAA